MLKTIVFFAAIALLATPNRATNVNLGFLARITNQDGKSKQVRRFFRGWVHLCI